MEKMLQIILEGGREKEKERNKRKAEKQIYGPPKAVHCLHPFN